ncbi:MAG: metallo-mystery pair system four-Cys motif protein [Myxococcales bacterium FL481]|nr:MAG: metallo-mystery pair system four-Cys motif protein [Myxococcales bacterium FL481]
MQMHHFFRRLPGAAIGLSVALGSVSCQDSSSDGGSQDDDNGQDDDDDDATDDDDDDDDETSGDDDETSGDDDEPSGTGGDDDGTPDGPEDGEVELRIPFRLVAGDEPVACDEPVEGIGTGEDPPPLQLIDAGLFLHGFSLVDGDGEDVPFRLHQGGDWQLDSLVLLDFATDAGPWCEAINSPETNTEVLGYVAEDADVAGVQFHLGVPDALNHLSVLDADPPLSVARMFWSWTAGYRYLKLDFGLERDGTEGMFLFHPGAEGCDLTDDEYHCDDYRNAAYQVALDPSEEAVALDIAVLWGQVDLMQSGGCMGSGVVPVPDGEDGETVCPTIYGEIGLDIADMPAVETGEHPAFRAMALD